MWFLFLIISIVKARSCVGGRGLAQVEVQSVDDGGGSEINNGSRLEDTVNMH